MHNNKLLKTLAAFSKDELKDLEKFIKSPFFDKEKSPNKIIALFLYIKKYHPKYEHKALSKERAFKQLFDTEPFNKLKIERVIGSLHNKIKRFISFQFNERNHDFVKEQLALAKFYKDRNLPVWFESTIEKLQEHQKGLTIREQDFYQNQFLIEREIHDFNSVYNFKKGDLNLPSTINNLDIFYVLSKLMHVCFLLSQNQNISIELDKSLVLIKAIGELIEQDEYFDIPIIKLYYQVFFMLRHTETVEPFTKFRTLLQEYKTSISTAELKNLKAYERNYLVMKTTKGDTSFRKDLFDLYKEQLQEGYIYYEGKLLPGMFRNIVKCGLFLDEFVWVNQFLTEHKDRIGGTHSPDDVYQFNRANYFFYIKEYEKAVDILASKYEDRFYHIAARRLKLMCYYETKSPILEHEINAFNRFIRNKSLNLSENYKEHFTNFVNMFLQIIHPNTFKNKQRIDTIINRIENLQRIAEKAWLIEKLEELR